MVWLFVFDMGYCRYDNDLGIGMGLAFLIAWAFDGGDCMSSFWVQ